MTESQGLEDGICGSSSTVTGQKGEHEEDGVRGKV